MLYQIGLISSFSLLSLWLLFQDNQKVSPLIRILLLLGMGSYLYSIFFSEAALDVKLWNLSRDLVLLSASAAFLSFFKNKIPLFIALLAGFTFLGLKYYAPIGNTQLYSLERIHIGTNSNQFAEEGEFLVELNDPSSYSNLQHLKVQYDLTIRPAFSMSSGDITELDDYVLVDVPPQYKNQITEIQDEIRNTKGVDWIENNDIVQINPIPSETTTRKRRTYIVNDPEINKQWGLDEMAMDELHDLLKSENISPKKKALIAILDTGIDAKHEDLAANYKSINVKYDTDGNQHGTHCAGIAAAVTNNGKGIASFSPNNDFVEIGSVRVLAAFGGGTQQGIINGILEAADAGADVISMSLGGISTHKRQKAYEKAVKYANKKGAIVIVAAGNSNKNAKDYCPANADGVITVSAVDENLNRAKFSNFVQDMNMGIAAPGVNIFSTTPNNEYKSFNGTSMATPYVAGLVGLMKSIQPDLSTKDAYKILKNTGKQTNNDSETGRFIQPAEAIKVLIQ